MHPRLGWILHKLLVSLYLVNLMYSKTDTVTVEDGGIDDLVNFKLFRGLRKDMSDQKVETGQLNRSLRQEQ